MATAGGPNIERDGLVFGMDTSYGIDTNNISSRFYTGEPTTNLVPSGQSIGTSAFQRQGSHVEVFTYSQITNYEGRPHVHRLYINPTTSNPYADYGGQYYKSGGSVVGDVYTISFDYYLTKGTGTPGMVVVYANGYKTPTSSEAASLSSATVIDLEDGWKRKTQTATITTAGNSWFRLGLNSNSVETEVYIDNFQVELKSHVTPFVNGTRSSTQSLIDLTKTTDIDVSNVSFDSTGQPTFDGTDDEITIPYSDAINTNIFTVECVAKLTTADNTHKTVICRNSDVYASYTNGWHIGTLRDGLGNGNNDWRVMFYGDSTHVSLSDAAGGVDGKYHHIAAGCDGTNVFLYVDGSLINSTSKPSGNLYTPTIDIHIARNRTGNDHWAGDIPVAKFYNRALSADEVQQNYKAYKNRFNL